MYLAGESWMEDPGAYHWVSANASSTESASFIATFVAPSTQTEFVVCVNLDSIFLDQKLIRHAPSDRFDCPACEVVKGSMKA